MISVQCACGKAFMTKPANAGKKTKCPTCGNMLTIPGGAAIEVSARADEIDDLLGSWPPTTAPPPPPSGPSGFPGRPVSAGFQSAAYVSSSSNASRPASPRTFEYDSNVLFGLFDLNFRRFITPSIIKSLYVSHIALILICILMLMFSNYVALVEAAADERGSPWLRYFFIVFTNLMAFLFLFIWTLVVRLGLEAIMVLFRGEEHLRALVEQKSDV